MKTKLYHTEHNYAVSKCNVCQKKMNPTGFEQCPDIHQTALHGTHSILAKQCKIKEHFVYVIFSNYLNFACSKKCALFAILQNI
jgi:hypothetical protein